VLEKAPGRFSADQLHSVTIEEIRTGGPDAVCENLMTAPKGGVVIVNAAAESDMHVFVAGLLLGMGFRFPGIPLCNINPCSSRVEGETLPLPHRRSLRLNTARHPVQSTHLRRRASPPLAAANGRANHSGLIRPQDDGAVESTNGATRGKRKAGNYRDPSRRAHRVSADGGTDCAAGG
jgi:hypothetical protein